MTKRVVAKFGGTSMADAEAMRQSASVAREQKACLVVVSATSGTTDQLIELARIAVNDSKSESQKLINEIAERHMVVASELEAPEKTLNLQENLIEALTAHVRVMSHQGELRTEDLDELMSFGERLSSNLMVVAMNEFDGPDATLLDAREIIITDDHFGYAQPESARIRENAKQLIPELEATTYVTQGFIGKNAAGQTTTLGRGGSDYSGALFAEAINADELQIWTDVAGVASTDPRMVSAARPIDTLSFQEAAELATSGAHILHPPTMIPARRANIPIFVGNTFEPEAGGTTIDAAPHSKPLVRAITVKKNQYFITLNSPRMSQQAGFLHRVFGTIAGHKVSIDQITTSEVAVSMTVDGDVLEHKQLFEELAEFAEVTVEEDLALVTLIGNKVNHTAGLTKRVFDSLQNSEPHMSVRAIFQGASKHSIGMMVAGAHAKLAVERLHKTFIEGEA